MARLSRCECARARLWQGLEIGRFQHEGCYCRWVDLSLQVARRPLPLGLTQPCISAGPGQRFTSGAMFHHTPNFRYKRAKLANESPGVCCLVLQAPLAGCTPETLGPSKIPFTTLCHEFYSNRESPPEECLVDMKPDLHDIHQRVPSLGFQRRFILHVFCERRFCARSSFVQAQLISLNNSGAARAQDQSVQRLDLRSHKTSGGITKGQAETHRFTSVKIHGRKRAFTLENRLSRQLHGIFTVISRYFCVHHGPLCSHQNCCAKTCWGGTGFVESKRGNSMNNPSNTTPWLIAGAL